MQLLPFELVTSEGGMLRSWKSTYKAAYIYVCLQTLDNPWDFIWLFCLLLACMTFSGQRGRLRSAELAVGGTNFLRVFASLHQWHLPKKGGSVTFCQHRQFFTFQLPAVLLCSYLSILCNSEFLNQFCNLLYIFWPRSLPKDYRLHARCNSFGSRYSLQWNISPLL